ncbi:MAG: hypothetical protein IPF57_14245 [Gammaproteobacteria bacterium]|nr:hypothetical protein [Gammaproteobacteria bacterium]
MQLVASREVDGRRMLSLSSNTDTSLDLLPWMAAQRARGVPCMAIAQVHADMPFMYNRALVEPECFDAVLANPEYDKTLFAAPNLSVGVTDFAIGMHTSALLRDGGTAIGIASLGDAIVYSSRLRHEENAAYREVIAALGTDAALAECIGGLGRFETGLYGCSEMFVNGFLHLLRAGIVRRRVYDHPGLQRALNQSGSERPDRALLAALRDTGALGSPLAAADVALLKQWGVFDAAVQWREGMLARGASECPADIGDEAALAAVCAFALGEKLLGGIHMHGGFFLGPRDFYEARAGKIDPHWEIPEASRHNFPGRIAAARWPVARRAAIFPAFPLGTDFTPEEIALGVSLKDIKA